MLIVGKNTWGTSLCAPVQLSRRELGHEPKDWRPEVITAQCFVHSLALVWTTPTSALKNIPVQLQALFRNYITMCCLSERTHLLLFCGSEKAKKVLPLPAVRSAFPWSPVQAFGFLLSLQLLEACKSFLTVTPCTAHGLDCLSYGTRYCPERSAKHSGIASHCLGHLLKDMTDLASFFWSAFIFDACFQRARIRAYCSLYFLAAD